MAYTSTSTSVVGLHQGVVVVVTHVAGLRLTSILRRWIVGDTENHLV